MKSKFPSDEIKSDLFRYTGIISKSLFIKKILTNPGARFIFLFRMCNKYRRNSILGVIFRFWKKILSDRKNVEIPNLVEIKKGMYFGHLQNIVINQSVKIGENCNIMQGVTIGNESRGKRKGCPTIGNRVLIGPNSVVVGKITIGNDVLVGPLTFVNFDVPSNSVVVGNPAKIINSNGSSGYINKIYMAK